MIVGWTGLPGASKTTSLARVAIRILYRNKSLYETAFKKYELGITNTSPSRRQLWANDVGFNPSVYEEFDGYIQHWSDVEQLTAIRDADVLIDEAMVYFDARSWEHMSLDIRRWLAQHRKHGVEIYFTAQEFSQVDIAFRRLVSNLFYLTKLVGSRDISATLPPPRFPWAIIVSQEIDPVDYEEKKKTVLGMPSLNLITRSDFRIFDTTSEIKGSKFPPLKHIKRECGDPDCIFTKVSHV